jgi:hypothetical protein
LRKVVPMTGLKFWVQGCAVVATLGIAVAAHGQVNRWISPTHGFWETGTNWSAGRPSSGHSLFITNAISKFVTIDNGTVDDAPSSLTVSNLTMSAPLGTTNTLDMFDTFGAVTPVPLRIRNTCTIGTRAVLSVDTSEIRIGELTNGKLIVNGSVDVVVGRLAVTNSSANAELLIQAGTLTFNGGTMTTDRLVATNSAQSVMMFRRGTLHTRATTVANDNPFVVGNGTQNAVMNLLGGVHSFADTLVITNNAALTGCGTLVGTVINHGTITASCAMASFIFDGPVTNHGTITAGAGTLLDFRGPVVNSRFIDASAGSVVFELGITNVNGGTVLLDINGDADQDGFSNADEDTAGTDPLGASSFPGISEITHSGDDVVVKIFSAVGRVYRLEWRDSPTEGDWAEADGPVAGTGGLLELTDLGGGENPQRVYRVTISLPN